MRAKYEKKQRNFNCVLKVSEKDKFVHSESIIYQNEPLSKYPTRRIRIENVKDQHHLNNEWFKKYNIQKSMKTRRTHSITTSSP